MSFSDNFTGASLDARWAGSSATLDDPNDRVDLSAGDLASIAGVISNAEFNELDLTFVPELTALYSSGAVYCYIVKDGSTSEIGARVHLDRQSSGGGSDRIILSWQSSQFGGWSVVQTISGQNFSSNPTIRVQRNSSGQWTISVNGSAVITNEAEPTAITNESNFNGGLTFSNTSGGYLHSVESAGLTRFITDIDGDDDVQVGQTGVAIDATGLDASPATQTVELGGEALTVTNWNSGAPFVTIPDDIDLAWGQTYTLSITDDTGTVTLSNVTLSAPAGWDTVKFSSAPNTTDTESFYEEAISDAGLGGGGFTMAAGDVLAFETATGLTVDSQTIPSISPPATVTGAYKIYDTSAGTWTSESTYTWTDAGAPAAPADVVTIDSITPTRTGATIEWSYPGSDVDSYEYNIDGGAWIAATSPLTLTGQTSSTTYTFNIRPLNQGTPGSTTSQQYTTTAAVDTTPNPFSFTDVSGVELGSVNASGAITVQGVDAGQDVSVAVTGGEYRVSTDGGSTWGAWTSTSGNVRLNHQIQVRGTAHASNYLADTDVTLTLDGSVSDTFTITTKADDIAPTIALNGNATVNINEGDTYTEQGATWTDNVDGTGAATVGGDTVDTNTVGTYTVTYDYTDAAGNAAAQVTRTVNVLDASAPTITLLGSATVTHAQGSAYNDAGATATDAVDGDLTADITVTGLNFDVNTVGSYTIRYNVSDAQGNAAAEVTRTVNVTDQTAPTITLVGGNVTIPQGGTFNEGYSATDNNDGDITADVVVGGDTVDTNTPGVYTITYDVTDAAGNAATQRTRTVTVQALVEVEVDYIPRLLSTDVKEVMLFAGRGNRFRVQISHDGSPVDLSVFTRFELYGLTTDTLNSNTDVGVFDTNDGNGVINIDPGLIPVADLIVPSGPAKTTLIGYTAAEAEGVVLWQPQLSQARVTVNIINA